MRKPLELCGLLFLLLHITRGVSVTSAAVKLNPVVCGGGGRCSAAAAEEVGIVGGSVNRATGRRYISYNTLIRDLVPCDRPGASYYNCRDHGVANFYNRGCQVITRCARGD